MNGYVPGVAELVTRYLPPRFTTPPPSPRLLSPLRRIIIPENRLSRLPIPLPLCRLLSRRRSSRSIFLFRTEIEISFNTSRRFYSPLCRISRLCFTIFLRALSTPGNYTAFDHMINSPQPARAYVSFFILMDSRKAYARESSSVTLDDSRGIYRFLYEATRMKTLLSLVQSYLNLRAYNFTLVL